MSSGWVPNMYAAHIAQDQVLFLFLVLFRLFGAFSATLVGLAFT